MYVHVKLQWVCMFVAGSVSGNGMGLCDYQKCGGHVSGQKWEVTWIMVCGLIAWLHFTHLYKRLQSFHNLHNYLCMCLPKGSSHCTMYAPLAICPSIYLSFKWLGMAGNKGWN